MEQSLLKKVVTMEKVLKQAVGIDCGKMEMVVSIGYLNSDFQTIIRSTCSFTNDLSGFDQLINWVSRHRSSETLQFVIEATGVYHERLCYYLTSKGHGISVVLANRAASFMRTLAIKTVNDKVASISLVAMGLEKKLENWQMPDPVMNQLKQLCRERVAILEDITSIKNQVHALTSGIACSATTLGRLQSRLRLSQEQLKEIEEEMKAIVKSDEQLRQRFDNVCTIKGVGLITAITIVAETNGFNLIRNHRQLVSYAGLDIIKKQSGTSINTPGRISRRGNTQIRRALHFPALAAIRHDVIMQGIYQKLLAKHSIKMKAAVAVQRKLLVLIYTLWKKNEPYNPKFLEQSNVTALTELVHDRS